MTINFYINSTDRSDYILSCGLIPHIKRSLIFEPIVYGFTALVSDAITVTKDQSVRVTVGGTNRFYGYAKKVKHIKGKHYYEVYVVPSLMKLGDKLIEYDELNTGLAGGSPTNNEYQPSDNFSLPNVALLYLLETMFDESGLALDTSNLVGVEFETTGGTRFDYEDVVFDENMLYALDQPKELNHRMVDNYVGGEFTLSDKITFLDFFKRICIGRKLVVYPDSATVDKYIIREHNTSFQRYTVADDDQLYFDEDDHPKKGGTLRPQNIPVLYTRAHFDGYTFTVDTGADTINDTGHDLEDDMVVWFEASTTLPSPLTAETDYYVVNSATNTFQVSSTKGGSALDITTSGSGTLKYYSAFTQTNINSSQTTGDYTVPYWKNLDIYYHLAGTSIGSVSGAIKNLITELLNEGYNEFLADKQTETIACATLDFTKYSIQEHLIDIDNKRHQVKQLVV